VSKGLQGTKRTRLLPKRAQNGPRKKDNVSFVWEGKTPRKHGRPQIKKGSHRSAQLKTAKKKVPRKKKELL